MPARDLQRSDTKNWGAFHLATEALRDIDRFVDSFPKDVRVLEEAKSKLHNAVKKDPEFNRARYYVAIVDDMLGNPSDAVHELKELLGRNPTFKDEAEYNLGVSQYHRYYRQHILEAINLFRKVIGESSDIVLKYMARAGLVRSFSMMVLHSSKESDEAAASEFFAKAETESRALLSELESDTSVNEKTKTEITWRVLNGRGVGVMFASDLQKDVARRRQQAQEALKDFREADKRSPDNWEIVCNLGSIHMRVGYTYKKQRSEGHAEKEFEKGKEYLRAVIDRIRPNYGFALYEMGRIYRLDGQFDEARQWFERAMMIPEKNRNVSDGSIEKQIEKAKNGDGAL
jgi:tetratricopeptide (TPR) repeat protein